MRRGGFVHGHARRKKKHPLYGVWSGMKQRCYDRNHIEFKRYGARGIRVCKRWRESFAAFLADVGERPIKKGVRFSLERICNSKGYRSDNVRWATFQEQMRNMRDNHRITFRGRTQVLQAWADELKIDQSLLRYRLKAWGVERAFTTPVRRQRARS